MRITKILAAIFVMAAPASAETQYARIGPGPSLDYARAYCDNASMGVGSGYFAYGRPAFVMGAALGNAIGNAIIQDRFYGNCMVMQGWKRIRSGFGGGGNAQPFMGRQK